MMDKIHIITSIDAENVFGKIQLSFMIKTLSKVGIEGSYLNVRKVTHEKPTANIILHRKKKTKSASLRLGTRQGCLLSPLIQYSTGSTSHSNQIRRNKRHLNWKGRNKTVII